MNEAIRDIAVDSSAGLLEWEFYCECGDPRCEERVVLSVDDYDALHDRGYSVLAAGHGVR